MTSGGSTGMTSGGTSGGSAAGGYTIGSDGSVRDARGVMIGRLNAAGDVVNASGQVVLRGLSSGASGGTSGVVTGSQALPGSMIDGRTGQMSTSGTVSGASGSTGGMSAGDFTVRADGSVVNSSGAVIGRVNANGEIISGGRVIGRVKPRG